MVILKELEGSSFAGLVRGCDQPSAHENKALVLANVSNEAPLAIISSMMVVLLMN